MKRLFFVALLFSTLFACRPAATPDRLFHLSVIDALLAGVYDSDYTFAKLKTKGDFGLGTVNNLDGELIVLDGKFYQVKSDGLVYNITPDMKTPGAFVHFFRADRVLPFETPLPRAAFQEALLKNLSINKIYGLRIDGTFSYIKARSIHAQKKPYRPLLEVSKEQKIFEFKDVEGTLVGYYMPPYLKGIGVPGFHFHFLRKDRKAGGHVLDLDMKNVKVQVDELKGFTVFLPDAPDFYKVDLSKNRAKDLKKIE